MNKKVSLVTLIEASITLSDDDKLALIDRVPSLNEKQVDALGKFFATERQLILDHKSQILVQFDALLAELGKKDNRVLVGSGKPN